MGHNWMCEIPLAGKSVESRFAGRKEVARMALFTEKEVYELQKVITFFETCGEGLYTFGNEGMTNEYADKVGEKYLFLVISNIRALKAFETRMLDALTKSKKREPYHLGLSGTDVLTMIAARYWVGEIGRLCYRNPKSKVARHMALKGIIDMGLSENGNDYVERNWREYEEYLTHWIRIMYEYENMKREHQKKLKEQQK